MKILALIRDIAVEMGALISIVTFLSMVLVWAMAIPLIHFN